MEKDFTGWCVHFLEDLEFHPMSLSSSLTFSQLVSPYLLRLVCYFKKARGDALHTAQP